MKKIFIISMVLIGFLVSSAAGDGLTFWYEKTIDKTVQPYPLAVNSSGGLFFGTFNASSSALVYIADPIHADDVFTTIATYSLFPTGRGVQGVTVDSSDNVFVSGDYGGPPGLNTSAFEKFNPPSFTKDTTFNPDMTGVRILGCAMFGPYVATITFTSIRCYDAIDGSYDKYIYITDNMQTYQRDIGVNPANWDIFASRNGSFRNGSVVYYSGGSPSSTDSNMGYTRISYTFIDNIMEAQEYADAAHGIGFYPARNFLFVNNKGTEPFENDDHVGTLDVYLITGTGVSATATLVKSITGSESGTQLGEFVDAVMFQYTDAERLFISDEYNDRILVYTYGAQPTPTPTPGGWTAAKQWTIYE
jgi:hypothetical protein